MLTGPAFSLHLPALKQLFCVRSLNMAWSFNLRRLYVSKGNMSESISFSELIENQNFFVVYVLPGLESKTKCGQN